MSDNPNYKFADVDDAKRRLAELDFVPSRAAHYMIVPKELPPGYPLFMGIIPNPVGTLMSDGTLNFAPELDKQSFGDYPGAEVYRKTKARLMEALATTIG